MQKWELELKLFEPSLPFNASAKEKIQNNINKLS